MNTHKPMIHFRLTVIIALLACSTTLNSAQAQWWRSFGDQLLDSLIEVGLHNNYDVLAATRRIEAARAGVGSAQAAYFPKLDISAAYSRAKSDGAKASTFSGLVDMSWQIDLFGKITANVREQKHQVKLSQAERAGVDLTIETEIASYYAQLRVEQAQLSVARDHAASQQKVVKIAEARFEAGIASMLDVDQARQVYYSTIASIPMLENSIHSNINQIAVLIAADPQSIYARLTEPAPLPDYVQVIANHVDANTLRNRTDVQQAECNIEVYTSQLGIAKKDWLPDFTVTGTLGAEAHKLKDITDKNSVVYSIVPTLSWTLFDGLARRYNIVAAEQALMESVDNYNLVMLTAVSEASNVIATYHNTIKYIDALLDVVKESELYNQRSVDNYKNGLSPFINVADAQMTYLENVNSLIVAQGQALTALINYYKAIP
jgi:NodT family efflux transporter outer membrane factor (OMF) lipoprotein